jgi:hypothetical protein
MMQSMASFRGYRRPDPGTQTDHLHPPYVSSIKRAPSKPLVNLPRTLSEVTGPSFDSFAMDVKASLGGVLIDWNPRYLYTLLDSFFTKRSDLFDWVRPNASTIGFAVFKPPRDVQEFCDDVVRRSGVMLHTTES